MRYQAIIVSIAILLILTAGGFFIYQSQTDESQIRTAPARLQNITQDIALTGRVEAVRSSDISFELPGTVIKLFVQEDDPVTAGAPLASLDTSSASLELAQARDATASSQDTKKLALAQAENDLKHTRSVNETTLAKRRQAVRDAKQEVGQAKKVHQQRAAESGDTAAITETAIATLRAAESTYHAAQRVLSEIIATVAQDNADAEAAVATARANYLAELSGLETAQAIVGHKVSKHYLLAPFSGTVTAIHRQMGEAALAGQAVVTVATVDQLELVAEGGETDALAVSPGLPATVTFDALGNTDRWSATVTYVAKSATFIEGLSTYTIKLALTEDTARLRAGLTANITIHAAAISNVLAVPRRAVTARNGEEFVYILQSDQKYVERPIATGLIGSDGTVEVSSGLAVNDLVVLNPSELSRSQ